MAASHIFDGFKKKVDSKYKWKICEYIEGRFFPVFVATKEGSDINYYCNLIHKVDKDAVLGVVEECKNYSSIIPIEDLITIGDITYIFFERAKPISKLYSVNEKKLLELLIEIYDVNISDDTNLSTLILSNRIVSKGAETSTQW